MKKRVLTGINTTGTLHIGNYVGAIRPAIQDSKNPDVQSFFFMADLHIFCTYFIFSFIGNFIRRKIPGSIRSPIKL